MNVWIVRSSISLIALIVRKTFHHLWLERSRLQFQLHLWVVTHPTDTTLEVFGKVQSTTRLHSLHAAYPWTPTVYYKVGPRWDITVLSGCGVKPLHQLVPIPKQLYPPLQLTIDVKIELSILLLVSDICSCVEFWNDNVVTRQDIASLKSCCNAASFGKPSWHAAFNRVADIDLTELSTRSSMLWGAVIARLWKTDKYWR